jgi:hypothetical protein
MSIGGPFPKNQDLKDLKDKDLKDLCSPFYVKGVSLGHVGRNWKT